MDLTAYPDPILRKKAAVIEEITDEVVERAHEMLEIMYENRGVGLAAPQVGWGMQLCVINPTPQDRSGELVCINPVIVAGSGEATAEEGCLSLPEVRGNVPRFATVTCRWYDLEGKRHEIEADGLLARVFQHELDHLNGRLVVDRMTPASRLSVRSHLKQLERDYKAP